MSNIIKYHAAKVVYVGVHIIFWSFLFLLIFILVFYILWAFFIKQ